MQVKPTDWHYFPQQFHKIQLHFLMADVLVNEQQQQQHCDSSIIKSNIDQLAL